MSDEQSRQQEMMQEALDGQLSEDMARKLVDLLGNDQSAAVEFQRLQQVDLLLKRAPQQARAGPPGGDHHGARRPARSSRNSDSRLAARKPSAS